MPLCFACIYFTCFDQFKEAIGVTSEDYIVETVENLIRRGDVWVEDSLKEYDARYGRQALFEVVISSDHSGAERKDDSLGPHVAASEKTLLPGANVASYGT